MNERLAWSKEVERRQVLRKEESKRRWFLYKKIIMTAEKRLLQNEFVVLVSPKNPIETLTIGFVENQYGSAIVERRLVIESTVILPSTGFEKQTFRLVFDPQIKNLIYSKSEGKGIEGTMGFDNNEAYEALWKSIRSWEILGSESR